VSRIDGGVAIERWSGDGPGDDVAGISRAVLSFARRHGMPVAGMEDVGGAVSEAIAYATDRGSAAVSAHSLLVEAATDGAWLSVRVAGGARRGGAVAESVLGLPLVMTVADRFEYGAESRRAGTSVLMEFAMTPPPDLGRARRVRTRSRRRGASVAPSPLGDRTRGHVGSACGRTVLEP